MHGGLLRLLWVSGVQPSTAALLWQAQGCFLVKETTFAGTVHVRPKQMPHVARIGSNPKVCSASLLLKQLKGV